MKSSVLIETPENELIEMLNSEKDKLYKMRIGHEVSPLENPKLITITRKLIARIQTEISRRRLDSKNK